MVEGDLWVEDTTYYVHVFKSGIDASDPSASPAGSWVALTGDQSALGKNFRIIMGVEPPADPDPGDCWFDTVDTELRIYMVDENPSGTDEPGWFPVSSGGIGISKFVDETSTAFINYQIQDMNARLAAT